MPQLLLYELDLDKTRKTVEGFQYSQSVQAPSVWQKHPVIGATFDPQ
jgi:hypothetical protein